MYIIIYGCQSLTHFLPTYFLNMLVLKEIAYQTIRSGGFIAFLLKRNKNTWSRFSIKLGNHYLINFLQDMKEVESLEEIVLLTGVFRRHDPKGIVWDNCKLVRWWPHMTMKYILMTHCLKENSPMMRSKIDGDIDTQHLGFPYNEILGDQKIQVYECQFLEIDEWRWN